MQELALVQMLRRISNAAKLGLDLSVVVVHARFGRGGGLERRSCPLRLHAHLTGGDNLGYAVNSK